MTATAPTLDATTQTSASALRARDRMLIATPVLAGVLITIACITDPAAGIDGAELARLYGENPDMLAVHALTLHFGFALWVLPALLIPRLVRSRGAWLANVGAVLGFLGICTLPGLMFSDFFTSAIYQEYGAAGDVAINERMEAMWGVGVFALQGMVPAIFAFVVAAAALWRARLLPWWGALLVVLAFVAVFGSGFVWWGGVLMTLCLAGFTVPLRRAVLSASPQDHA